MDERSTQEKEEDLKQNTEEKTEIEKRLEALEKEGKIPKAGEENKAHEEVSEKALTAEQEAKKSEMEEKRIKKQKDDLAKKETAYKMLQQGAYFMKFIYDNIEAQKKQHINRPQRRRFEKELKKGIFSKELVEVYAGKIDQSLDWIQKNVLNAEQTLNRISTHYKTKGFDNPEFLKAILEDYFKTQFSLKGEEEPVDGAEYYEELKKQEVKDDGK